MAYPTLPVAGCTPAQFDVWITTEVKKALPIVYNDTVSTALFRKITRTQALSLGVAGLCGCTLLVVYSAKALYIGHYFEDLSFANAAAFQTTVLEALQNGIPNSATGVDNGQDSLASHAADFGQGVKAWHIYI